MYIFALSGWEFWWPCVFSPLPYFTGGGILIAFSVEVCTLALYGVQLIVYFTIYGRQSLYTIVIYVSLPYMEYIVVYHCHIWSTLCFEPSPYKEYIVLLLSIDALKIKISSSHLLQH